MDREIDPALIRKRRTRRIVVTVAVLVVGWIAMGTVFGMLRPGVPFNEIRTARVERGPVAEVIDATGVVVPASEKVLSSPVEARVVEILVRPGALLAAGDPILRLDTSASRLEVDRLEDRTAQKESERTQLRLTLDRDRLDLETRSEEQKLDVEVLEHRLEQSRTLAREGLISTQQLMQVEAEAKKATLGSEQLTRQIENARASASAQLDAIELELRTLRNELGQARRELELATAKADRAGVLTWVVGEAGMTLQRGQIFARIADQSSYRVEATTSDIHASRLATGMPVEVRVAGGLIRGTVASVNPAIENGALHFEARLDEPSNPKLRNSMRVEVSVIGGERTNVLKVARGPFATGARREQVFVVRGGAATRRDVELGAFGREEIEVVSGLAEGDEVIVSNTSEYRHAGIVRITGR